MSTVERKCPMCGQQGGNLEGCQRCGYLGVLLEDRNYETKPLMPVEVMIPGHRHTVVETAMRTGGFGGCC